MKTFQRNILSLAVVGALVSGTAIAADATSSGFLYGVVENTAGESVSGVTIEILNKDTGLQRVVTTGNNGSYRFPLLPAGTYDVTVKKNGQILHQQTDVNVRVGTRTNIPLSVTSSNGTEVIEVVGSRISSIDVASSEAVTIVDQEFLARVPVSRDIASVAMLAPGTTKGDESFGNIASFGGSSVGENSYYVNGMNVTNFRNGLGGADVPFDFYDSFEVKTGGYSAEFGRSTGGVINATTRRGSNTFEYGGGVVLEPSSLRETSPQAYRSAEGEALYGTDIYHRDQEERKVGKNEYTLYAGGALIEDKLFFFGLANYNERDSDYAEESTKYVRESGDLFLALKLDYYITDDHIIEFTGWDSSSDLDSVKYNWDSKAHKTTSRRGDYTQKRGGKTYSFKYTGILTDTFTMSAMYGVNEANYSNVNAGSSPFGEYPRVYERFSSTDLGDWALSTPSLEEDKRTAYRLDFDWYVTDNHTLRFGIDREELEAVNQTQRAGGASYRYEGCADMDAVRAGDPSSCTSVRKEIYRNIGDFETKSSAYYITDTWTVTDDLTVTLGLRNETFENYNKAGEKFIDVSDQWAPRVGLSWDPYGEGEFKVFANFGRYFLPVATNTNVRMAGDELYTRQQFEVLGIADDISKEPILGEATGGLLVLADGTLKNTAETVNQDLDPMYQDEFILGFQMMLDDDWSLGVKGTYRNLGSSLEDIAVDKGFDDYLKAEFGSGCTLCDGFHYYVLTNPGSDVTFATDPDGDGPLANQEYTIPASYLGYPESERQYGAVDINLSKAWGDGWMLDLTYTWAHSWGNNEGFVRSDNEQDDAGATTNFDQPGLTDGAKGNLPNDRRHQIKAQFAYEITENILLGSNFLWQTGRPYGAYGYHPTDVFASFYDAESFYRGGELVPRGSLGTTPNTWSLDLSLQYNTTVYDHDLTFRADVFNVFNNDKPTKYNEVSEIRKTVPDEGDNFEGYRGDPDPDYLLPKYFQEPRKIRLSATFKF